MTEVTEDEAVEELAAKGFRCPRFLQDGTRGLGTVDLSHGVGVLELWSVERFYPRNKRERIGRFTCAGWPCMCLETELTRTDDSLDSAFYAGRPSDPTNRQYPL